MEDFFAKLEEISKGGKHAALVILTHTTGSTPRKAGSKMIVTEDGQIYGTIGGGNIEHRITVEAIRISRSVAPERIVLDLEDDADMHCGGSVEVYIEPVKPAQQLVIFGAGHVGGALAKYAPDFGFHVTLIDNRPEILEKIKNQSATLIHQDFLKAAEEFHSDHHTYFVVTTPRHAFDQEVTGVLANKPFRYLGMIGSKKKVAVARQHYLDNQILTEAQIEKINMPIGIAFNAQTPEEIAISILARLIDVKNS